MGRDHSPWERRSCRAPSQSARAKCARRRRSSSRAAGGCSGRPALQSGRVCPFVRWAPSSDISWSCDHRAPKSGLDAAPHARCRQGLRHARVRGRMPTHVRDAAHRGEGEALRARPPHDATRVRCRQSVKTQARRGSLRLGQDDRRSGEGESERPRVRSIQVHLRDGRMQSDTHAPTARQGVSRKGESGRLNPLHTKTNVAGSLVRGYGSTRTGN